MLGGKGDSFPKLFQNNSTVDGSYLFYKRIKLIKVGGREEITTGYYLLV